MDTEKTVLVAEDDENIIGVLRLYLENSGYRVLAAKDGIEALEIMRTEEPKLCLIDLMMPRMDGFSLIQKIRETNPLPILIISARRADSDRIFGLNIGADDYISKPFNPLEVLARVDAAYRRTYEMNQKDDEINLEDMTYRDLRLNRRTFQVYKNQQEINVTPTEFRILMMLMESPGRVFTKLQIASHINGTRCDGDENVVMVHISNLRDKLEADSKNPEYLITVRGLGYKLGR